MGVVWEDGRLGRDWSFSEGERAEGSSCEATEASLESIPTDEASGPSADMVGSRTAVGPIRRRLAEGSSTGDRGDRLGRTGLAVLAVLALAAAGTNGCESGTTLGGVPQESDCVRLMGFVLVKGGVAADGAVCGLSCREKR